MGDHYRRVLTLLYILHFTLYTLYFILYTPQAVLPKITPDEYLLCFILYTLYFLLYILLRLSCRRSLPTSTYSALYFILYTSYFIYSSGCLAEDHSRRVLTLLYTLYFTLPTLYTPQVVWPKITPDEYLLCFILYTLHFLLYILLR